jgi:hypothetical protein
MELQPRLTAEQIKIETVTPHDYLIHVDESDETVSIRLHLTEDVTGLFPSATDNTRIAEATIMFLLDHQRAYHLPADVDLDDIVAAYDDFIEAVSARLSVT